MSTFGPAEEANNAPIWVGAQVNKTPNSTNQGDIFANTTADAFITGQTVGVFGVSTAEAQAQLGNVTHPGWVLRRVGSGGRANRVTHETLVAGGFINTDVGNGTYPDAIIVFTTHPADRTVNNNSSSTFAVVARTVPANLTITYTWQEANSTNTTFANLANSGVYSNIASATMAISNVAGLNNYTYRCKLDVTGQTASYYSANAIVTVA